MANPNPASATQSAPPKARALPRRNKPAPPANFVLPRPVRIPSPPNHRSPQQG